MIVELWKPHDHGKLAHIYYPANPAEPYFHAEIADVDWQYIKRFKQLWEHPDFGPIGAWGQTEYVFYWHEIKEYFE